jgi:hypothetical protein
MPIPDNFALLALSPTIRENDGFLYLQTGQAGYIDLMVQSATGLPVNILKVGSGVPVSQYIYVNQNGNDSTAKKETIDFPFKSIAAALNVANQNDTIEVFPGVYNVSGNMYKLGVNYYLNKNSNINFVTNGKLHITGLDTGDFNIFGNGVLTQDSASNDLFHISGGKVTLEIDRIQAPNCNFLINEVASSLSYLVMKTKGEGTVDDGHFYFNTLNIKSSSTKFEGIKFKGSGISIQSNSTKDIEFEDCLFDATDSSPTNPLYKFSGKYNLTNCSFTNSYPHFTALGKSRIRNTIFNGGIVVSGSNYFDSCIFDTKASTLYPNSSLISNLGGNSLFSNCYVNNFNNNTNVFYTFRASGSASGASDFNINGTFSSFDPVFSGTIIKFGTFMYDVNLK